MKINPFEIGKIVNKAMKNKDRYRERIEELKIKPLECTIGETKAVYDIEKNRISSIDCEGVDQTLLDQIMEAVNGAFDKADKVWTEFD